VVRRTDVVGDRLLAAAAASTIQEPFQGEELKNPLDHVSLQVREHSVEEVWP